MGSDTQMQMWGLVAFRRLFYETCALSYKHFQFPMDLAVLAFPCNQFGHQENATNQVEYSKKEMNQVAGIF